MCSDSTFQGLCYFFWLCGKLISDALSGLGSGAQGWKEELGLTCKHSWWLRPLVKTCLCFCQVFLDAGLLCVNFLSWSWRSRESKPQTWARLVLWWDVFPTQSWGRDRQGYLLKVLSVFILQKLPQLAEDWRHLFSVHLWGEDKMPHRTYCIHAILSYRVPSLFTERSLRIILPWELCCSLKWMFIIFIQNSKFLIPGSIS